MGRLSPFIHLSTLFRLSSVSPISQQSDLGVNPLSAINLRRRRENVVASSSLGIRIIPAQLIEEEV